MCAPKADGIKFFRLIKKKTCYSPARHTWPLTEWDTSGSLAKPGAVARCNSTRQAAASKTRPGSSDWLLQPQTGGLELFECVFGCEIGQVTDDLFGNYVVFLNFDLRIRFGNVSFVHSLDDRLKIIIIIWWKWKFFKDYIKLMVPKWISINKKVLNRVYN